LVTFGISETELDQQTADAFIREENLYYRTRKETIRLMPQSVIRLRGAHNLLNVLAACAIALSAGLPLEAIRSGVSDFAGIPHRLEFVRSWAEADWFNDSIATTPERAIAAVRSFDEPLVLLLGGRDKDLSWDELADLSLQRVDRLIVFGEAAGKIVRTVIGAAENMDLRLQPGWLVRCEGLRQAVEIASRIVRPGDVVLLSPGGTSFDEFIDFEERGECFRQLVMQL
jgi:UDP-N-acetylmuramoylalanine--D-glutamate ligase